MKKILVSTFVATLLSFQVVNASTIGMSSKAFVKNFGDITSAIIQNDDGIGWVLGGAFTATAAPAGSSTVAIGVGATLPNSAISFVGIIAYLAATEAIDEVRDNRRIFEALGEDAIDYLADGYKSHSLENVLEKTRAASNELIDNEQMREDFIYQLDLSDSEATLVLQGLEDIERNGLSDTDIASVIYALSFN